jgi:hypothetical protein
VKSEVEIVIESYILVFMPLLFATHIQGYLLCLLQCCKIVYSQLPWFMNNEQFLFLLYAIRIFPDKNMESTAERKLSLRTFLWFYGRIFCHMWTITCMKYDTQWLCQG